MFTLVTQILNWHFQFPPPPPNNFFPTPKGVHLQKFLDYQDILKSMEGCRKILNKISGKLSVFLKGPQRHYTSFYLLRINFVKTVEKRWSTEVSIPKFLVKF